MQFRLSSRWYFCLLILDSYSNWYKKISIFLLSLQSEDGKINENHFMLEMMLFLKSKLKAKCGLLSSYVLYKAIFASQSYLDYFCYIYFVSIVMLFKWWYIIYFVIHCDRMIVARPPTCLIIIKLRNGCSPSPNKWTRVSMRIVCV